MTLPTVQPVTESELVEFLRSLAKPKTLRERFRLPPDRIADALRELEAYGYRRSAETCPIAVALQQKFPGHHWHVGTEAIRDDIRIKTPWYIRWFVNRFDRGVYRNLGNV